MRAENIRTAFRYKPVFAAVKIEADLMRLAEVLQDLKTAGSSLFTDA
ncbi:hypothetical protein HOLDEFILI_02096 [Holdemania filiformis DSM 12042]|uniref:Uncharacterized protein n=1 Tax=Holdemania filiformis DSM 12042 TaxID=545696 RepID=B9Y8E9_9FIRM|nr:hypothetical protein HOLDEFILI_02096 [Holdemania filiformis DSM 12042]